MYINIKSLYYMSETNVISLKKDLKNPMQLVIALLNNTGLVGETVTEAGDPIMQIDWAGSREAHNNA